MNCIEALRWISVTIDGEAIPAARRQALGEHLSVCRACRGNLDAETVRTQRLCTVLGREKAVFGDENDAQALLAGGIIAEALRRGTSGTMRQAPPRPVIRLRTLLAAAAAVLLASGLWLYFQPPAGLRLPDPDGSGSQAATFVLEHRTVGSDVVPSQDGAPLRRSTTKLQRQYRIPLGDFQEAKFTIEHTDTDYYRLANWSYQ